MNLHKFPILGLGDDFVNENEKKTWNNLIDFYRNDSISF